MFLKSSVSLKQEIKYNRIIDFIRILYTVMSDFIRDKSINIIDKMNVVLSFIASGGIIKIDGIPYFDTSNPLAIVNRLGIINDEQLEKLNDPWFFYNYKNIKPHFKLS